MAHYRQAVHAATDLALQTDKGIVLATSVLEKLRHQHIIIPALDVIERVCAEATTCVNRRIYEVLSEPLSNGHLHRLDDLLKRRENSKTTWLAWLRQFPSASYKGIKTGILIVVEGKKQLALIKSHPCGKILHLI
ncbi:Transposase (plasmid) [Desulforapulum autotrophicum HRM2]|uniref:Transposase n=1 Tax=Desulforapulum autotrophicum (strain ATCC 43914 / DSM 3382 / VKM B-1955 / HRM2) TaxID=177437 RepID=C0QMN0_DESAH|nr:Transposase [Desulforapulum autotrophicum HRM2]